MYFLISNIISKEVEINQSSLGLENSHFFLKFINLQNSNLVAKMTPRKIRQSRSPNAITLQDHAFHDAQIWRMVSSPMSPCAGLVAITTKRLLSKVAKLVSHHFCNSGLGVHTRYTTIDFYSFLLFWLQITIFLTWSISYFYWEVGVKS